MLTPPLRCRVPKAVLLAAFVVGIGGCDLIDAISPGDDAREDSLERLIPRPAEVYPSPGAGNFSVQPDTRIYVSEAGFLTIGELLADYLRPATGYQLTVQTSPDAEEAGIHLVRSVDASLGDEGFTLSVEADAVIVEGFTEAGLGWGVQAIRQLLPARIERDVKVRGPWLIPGGQIRDYPEYGWRGVMLDVARHFMSVEEVEKLIDAAALYRINRFHLHLTDDQGWRIMIESWPNLALIGGRLEVGGTDGGYYTQDDFRRLVDYAARRGVQIVPEIEMPGHVHAALASYPELACRDEAEELYTGIVVGFSTLCFDDDRAYDFVEDVVRELAAISPSPYFHIGGDETWVTPRVHYDRFVPAVEEILGRYGKTMVGWDGIAATDLSSSAVVQIWQEPENLQRAVERGNPMIISRATLAYLDSKYSALTPIGRTWTGVFLDVRTSYMWHPTTVTPGGANIVGIEGPLWTETAETIADVEYLAFPRLLGLAELGWSGSPADWQNYRRRLGYQGGRMRSMGLNYYRSPLVNWN